MSVLSLLDVLTAIITVVTVGVFVLKFVRGVDRAINFFERIERALETTTVSNEYLAKKLGLLFENVNSFLKKFRRDPKRKSRSTDKDEGKS